MPFQKRGTASQFKPGDLVLPKRGRGGPWVIQSIGSQPSLVGTEDIEVAIFQNGSFMDVKELRSDTAPDPSTTFDRKIRRLAEAAMSVCHHDCGEQDPEWHHEIMAMEERFRKILRGA